MSYKAKKIQKNFLLRHLTRGPVVIVLGCFIAGAIVAPLVHADQFDQQIQALQNQNAQTQGTVNSLQAQASSYQDAINLLQAQIAGLQAQIDANQVKQAELQQQILQDEADIAHEKQVLGTDIKAMYVGGQLTTVEQLATSKNLSAFVDAETYRSAVQNKIQTTLAQIALLENQQQAQKVQVDQLLQDQQNQQTQLDGDRAQQANLLSLNETQQAQYNQQIQSNQAQIVSLRAQQLAANRRLVGSGNVSILSSGSCGGDYPGDATSQFGHWGCNYGLDQGTDNWGMYNRECVSYTAWRVYQAYGYMPNWGGVGNADEWPSDAQTYHIPTGSSPKVGSVAIGTNPYYFGSVGHAMWVEAVYGDGTILVSQFNFNGPGQYSEMKINANLIDTFIYFGQ